MTVLHSRTAIAAPPDVVFDLTIDVDVHTQSAAGTGERAIQGVVGGKMRLGDTVTWRARHFGVVWRMTAKIAKHDRPASFTVIQVRGPFGHMLDRHDFVADGEGTLLEQRFEYSAPYGLFGRIVDRLFLRRHMERFLAHRNGYIKRIAEAGRRASAPTPAS